MKLGSIQFLRATAAILVVYAHSIDLTMSFGKIQDFYYLSEIGFIGQDFFFVISGFIITYTASQYSGLEAGVVFLQKRFLRVNLLYYIASLLYIGCHIWHVWGTAHMLPMPINMMLTSLADTLLVVPTTAEINGYNPLLMIGWVLAFGWFFYVLFFITIVAKVKRKISVLSIMIILLAGLGYFLKPTDLRLSFLINPILLEFLIGIFLCMTYLNRRKIPVAIAVGLVLAGIGWCIFLVFYGYGLISIDHSILNGSLSLKRVQWWGLPAGCVMAGCIILEKRGKLMRLWNNRVSNLTGDASYSIYLMHLPVFSLLALLYRKTGLSLPPEVGILIQVIVAVVVSIAFYWWVERPLLRWLNRPSRKTTILLTPSPQPQST